MRLIRLTLIIHLLLHAALWVSAALLVLAPWSGQEQVSQLYQVLSGALIIHLGSYHWAMAQWQEDLCENSRWPTSVYTALVTLCLGIAALLWPPAAVYFVLWRW